jgi:ankyrin repeat protein
MTPRMTAARLGRLVADGDAEAVRTAVAASPRLLAAPLERDGSGGWTPLHLAVAAGHEDVVRVLVAAGADLGARTEHARTPLHTALESAPHLVPVLRELGAPLDAAGAAYLDDADTLGRALDEGAPLSDPVDGDLLAWAAYGGAASTVDLLLARGADPDGGALHAAAGAGHAAVVRRLLDAGADVHRRDPDTGRTALHAAVASAAAPGDAPEVVGALLDAGADVNATTSDGASALDISRVAAARARSEGAGHAPGAEELAALLTARGGVH